VVSSYNQSSGFKFGFCGLVMKSLLVNKKNFWVLLNFKNYFIDIEGIMPEGRINKTTDLQETKFLSLFGLTNLHY
jgi:hypothetical protein